MDQGVDVSGHQRDIDWGAMRSGGISFAYIKASEGIGYTDPMLGDHWDASRDAGMTAGLYHYARPDTNAPESDAAHFAVQLNARGAAQAGALPPCLDMEQDADVDMVDWTLRCLDKVRELTDHGPIMVYANTSWWNDQLGGGGWLDDQTYAWVAHYGRNPGQPGFSNDRTVMHQWTSSGRVNGYDDDIDLNVAWVDLAILTQGGPTDGGGGGGVPPWPLAAEHYFGLITGPNVSHGGWYANEQPHVRLIQQALQRKGFAPDRPGWADGRYEEPTRRAVIDWQRSVGYHQTGNIWPDDWDLLLS